MEPIKPLKHKNILLISYGLLIIFLLFISKMQNIKINENDWIIIFASVFFFMVAQTYFFIFIGSKQYENVIISKLDIIKKYGEKNIPFKFLLNSYKKDYLETNESEINNKAKEREANNMKLTFEYCGIPIIIVSSLLLILLLLTKTNLITKLNITNKIINNNLKTTDWSNYNTIGLLLVLLAYITESLMFYFVIKKYNFVNDNTIYHALFKYIYL
jgi:hypothetical protein